MMDFTVEVATRPVVDDDWSLLRRVLDTVPGALLLEDPEEPTLIIPVEASDPGKAVLFVDGLSKMMGFEVTSGRVSPSVDDDFDGPEDDVRPRSTPVVTRLQDWVGTVPELHGSVNSEGRLLDA